MIVQSAPTGAEHFIITMEEHTAFAGKLASFFGNEHFESLAPRSQMMYVIWHHDAGWRELDAVALRDPTTGLPYNLVKTPFARIVETSTASPDFHGRHHAYCELLSSMHSWGLYNGRYGMSDKVLLNDLADQNRTMADEMLAGEIARQQRLKTQLASDPETAGWVEETHLFQNYKQLQFFDTLALYFNCIREGERGPSTLSHVPINATKDTDVKVKPVAPGTYAFDPFPFEREGIEVSFNGRYLAPISEGPDVRDALERAPTASQTIRLVAAQ